MKYMIGLQKAKLVTKVDKLKMYHLNVIYSFKKYYIW